MTKTISEINKLFKRFIDNCSNYQSLIGEPVNKLDKVGVDSLKKIPDLLYQYFPKEKYEIKASVGAGRIAKSPWLAIMNKDETKSTQNGVYIVFIFSSNLKNMYISLNQGIANQKDDVEKNRDHIREKLDLKSDYFRCSNDISVENESYKKASIYDYPWKLFDDEIAERILFAYSNAYNSYLQSKGSISNTSQQFVNDVIRGEVRGEDKDIRLSSTKLIDVIFSTGLIYSALLIKRFAFSLMSKRFLILSGLAGSGKTQLAITFAQAMVKDEEEQMKVVAVGADWTNREPLLGFPNALQKDVYEKPESGVLDLLIEAEKHPEKPYFLILDEMNMSYVERYFADFLSAMESGRKIPLWDGKDDGVPASVGLSDNLFIIGTINVDETTYMFSPKVLDRANVLEFKISADEMMQFLSAKKKVDRDKVKGMAADMAEEFVRLSKDGELADSSLADKVLGRFFQILKKVNAEFGYRTATDIYRFISNAQKYDDAPADGRMSDNQIIDCAIVQKLLPKLHGSRKKLSDVLTALWCECFKEGEMEKETVTFTEEKANSALFPLTADKILRMHKAAEANGFASFAEA